MTLLGKWLFRTLIPFATCCFSSGKVEKLLVVMTLISSFRSGISPEHFGKISAEVLKVYFPYRYF